MIASPPLSRPQALFDFAGSGIIDPRLTFTRASTATRTNKLGYIETVPSGIPRIDYNPITGAIRGVLIEQQSTNLFLNSSTFSSWILLGASIGDSSEKSPRDIIAKKITESLVNETHQVYSAVSVVSGSYYSVSIYAKSAERNHIRISLQSSAFGDNYAVFNVSTGIVESSYGISAKITQAKNGFFRCSLSAMCISTRSANCSFVLLQSAGGPVVYTGNGVSGLLISDAQWEESYSPTSYIPTTTAQVTRAADSLSLQSLAFTRAINATECAIYIDYEINAAAWPASSPVIACLSNNSGTGEASGIILSASQAGLSLDATVSSASQAALSIAAGSQSGAHRVAFSYKTDGFALSADNTAPTTDSSGSIPSLTRLDIGSAIGARHFNGHIKRVAVFPRYADSTIIQSITQ